MGTRPALRSLAEKLLPEVVHVSSPELRNTSYFQLFEHRDEAESNHLLHSYGALLENQWGMKTGRAETKLAENPSIGLLQRSLSYFWRRRLACVAAMNRREGCRRSWGGRDRSGERDEGKN
ncbi:hypothetical protein ACFX11_003474 [Malus domestica]